MADIHIKVLGSLYSEKASAKADRNKLGFFMKIYFFQGGKNAKKGKEK